MPKKNLGGALDAVKGITRQQLPSAKRVMPLFEILDRPHGDTRSLNPAHVQELAESIAAVGLIQPLAVDKEGHLLAGGHRRAALQVLQEKQAARYSELFPSGIPVRVFEFNAKEDSDRAFVIEAAENEKRRDYTPSEVRDLAEQLVERGYRNIRGKPRKGQKALVPALTLIVGKSRSTVKRYLAEDGSTDNGPSGPLSKWVKDIKYLKKLEKRTAGSPVIARQAAKLRQMLEQDQ